MTVFCALMMVSRVRYTSFKGEKARERVPFWVMLLIVGFLGALMIDPPHVLFFAAAAYAVSGPLYWLWNKTRRRETPA
jgi:CDP-diacylglycerol--serine O-phosphatidyltransferase